jgi:hypothetical protein
MSVARSAGAAEQLEVGNLKAKVVGQRAGRLVMVLEHEPAETAPLRDSHLRDVGLSRAPGRSGPVHVKVHVDGALQQPVGLSLRG